MSVATCTWCDVTKPADTAHFPPYPAKANGLNSHCRECVRTAARERMRRRRADPIEKEKVREANRRHRASQKGRERKRILSQIDNHKRRQQGHPRAEWDWSVDAWERCKAAWGEACAYCARATATLVHDHVVPLCDPSSPGTVPENVVPACARCNGKKHTKALDEWCSSPLVVARVRRYCEDRRAERMRWAS